MCIASIVLIVAGQIKGNKCLICIILTTCMHSIACVAMPRKVNKYKHKYRFLGQESPLAYAEHVIKVSSQSDQWLGTHRSQTYEHYFLFILPKMQIIYAKLPPMSDISAFNVAIIGTYYSSL